MKYVYTEIKVNDASDIFKLKEKKTLPNIEKVILAIGIIIQTFKIANGVGFCYNFDSDSVPKKPFP